VTVAQYSTSLQQLTTAKYNFYDFYPSIIPNVIIIIIIKKELI